MTFDIRRTDLEALEADLGAVEPKEDGDLGVARRETPSLEVPPTSYADRFALIERLARQLALAHGEDPDEQPFPLRYPRWRFHCGRAKVLLAITPAEHQALAAVLASNQE